MNCQKDLFLLPEDHHYLNCSYLSPLLRSVEKAGIAGIQGKARPWEVTPDRFFEDSEKVRLLFADLIHAEDPQQVAIMPSVSYGMGTVVNNLPQAPGKEIVIAGEQFPSNVYPWKSFADRTGIKIRRIDPPSGKHRGSEWNRQILDAISPKTLLVALGNVHWTDGTLFDVVSISKKAREHGAYFVIDGTQSVGALPFDVGEVQPDALICAGYKWLMGPYGIAMGYFGPRLTGGIPLEEGWIVRKNSRDFSRLIDYEDDYLPGAMRYDVGQRSNFITLPMMREALAQVTDWGVEHIQTYIQNLTKPMIAQLLSAGYEIENSEFRSAHMFGARVPTGIEMERVSKMLIEKNNYVSIRGTAIRISPHVYNDENDTEALTHVLISAAKH